MDINYKKVTNVQNPAFIRQQKPLDIRTYVNTLDETDTIQNPYIGLMFYCAEDGKYYKVTKLKSGYYYLDDELVYSSKKQENDAEFEHYIIYDNALVAEYIELVHGSGSGGGGGEIEPPGGGTEPPVPVPPNPIDPQIEYTITYILENVDLEYKPKKISKGFAYGSILKLQTNYTLDSIQVTMNGETIDCYNSETNYIYIASVIGNVVITATASKPGSQPKPSTYKVSYYLVNFTSQNNYTTITKGETFTDTLTMTGKYNPTIKVTMNGQTTDYKLNGTECVINIENVTGNINIFATSQNSGDYEPPEDEPDYYPPIWEDEPTNDDYIWNYTINNPNGIKYRELIGYLAACVCCNAFYSNTRENGKPYIKFKPLYQTRTFGTLKSTYYKEFKRERSSFVVKQVIVDTGSANFYTKEAGANDDEKVLVNIPFGSQDIADYIGAKLIGLEPWGYNLKFIGNPQLEYGDKFNVIDLEGNPFTVICYTSKLTYNGGLSHDMSGVKLKPGNITNSYLEEKIMSGIEVTQDDINTNIAALKEITENLKYNDNNNKNTIGEMAGIVNALSGNVETNAANIKALERNIGFTNISDLKNDIDDIKGDMGDVKRNIGQLNDDIGQLNDDIDEIKGKDGLINTLNERIADLEKKIAELEKIIQNLT